MRFFTIFLMAALLGGPWISTGSAQNLSNRRAPSFSLPDSRLKQYDLLDYRGKWLLLAFLQTDCPPCKDLSRKLEPLKQKYAGKVEILSVMITPPATQQTVAQYIGETKIASPVVFDQGQMAVSYFKATPQNNSIDNPHLFAIDPQGTIVQDWTKPALALPAFLPDLERWLAGPAKKK